MLLLSGQGCGQPMQQMREGLMHGVCMWIPSRFAGRVYQSQPGRILWRKLTCLFVFICLFFAGVVFGLSSVYVQGGNRISTMFSALAVRNIMLGVPSGCFTGSFWYGGIQCTVFHFYRHSYCRGTRRLIFLSELMGPALSDLSLLLSRRLRTFGLYGYVAASFCREGSSRIAGRIYSIIFC